MASARSRWFGFFLGDQAPFLTRAAFQALGGFREWPLFEDLELCRRLGRLGRIEILDASSRDLGAAIRGDRPAARPTAQLVAGRAVLGGRLTAPARALLSRRPLSLPEARKPRLLVGSGALGTTNEALLSGPCSGRP